jgi:hypothetical protein
MQNLMKIFVAKGYVTNLCLKIKLAKPYILFNQFLINLKAPNVIDVLCIRRDF